jgi:radical SAM protein with 4Fe4S-binding SPASM domain
MLVEHSSQRLFLDGTKLLHHPRRLADWQSGKRVFPLHLDISPAGACNHRCVFCIVDYKEHRKGFLNGSILKKLLRDGAQLGVKSVLFAGDGEPLLNRDLPDAIVEGHDHGLSLALNTNAVMLKEDVAETVLPRLEWMRVSVAAGTAATYAEIHKCKERDFERAIENVARAAEMKRRNNLAVTIGIQQILLAENVHEMSMLAKTAKRVGADYYVVKRFADNPRIDYTTPPNLHRDYEDAFRDIETLSDDTFKVIVRRSNFEDDGARAYNQCLGLPFLAYVLADGGIYTCCGYYGDEEFCYGNLNEDTFENIWMSARQRQVIGFVENEVDVHTCMPHCRHHNINKLAWDLRNPPDHVNFI